MIPLAILLGILSALVLRWTVDRVALRTAARQIYADLLEFRLYFDEPLLIWRAWMNLLRHNIKLLLMFLPATLLLALPATWLTLQWDAAYGFRPLRAGEAAVVTAQLNRPPNATDRLDLRGTLGVTVETPPVKIPRDRQVVWRIRPSIAAQGALDLSLNGAIIYKSTLTRTAKEPHLPAGDLQHFAVHYPESEAAVPWPVWFLSLTTAAAILSSRYTAMLNWS